LSALSKYGYSGYIQELTQGNSKLPDRFLIRYSNINTLQKVLQNRIDSLCKFFNNVYVSSNLRKRKVEKGANKSRGVKKKPKSKVQKDENGNIIYPVKVSGSLTLIACGKVNPLPAYHSAHNIFPVGYISERSYASIFERGKKCLYRCEILDGGEKPIYKVTCSEDPQNPIIRDTSTGCWVHICKLVDGLAEVQK
jgi:hypothetical protein